MTSEAPQRFSRISIQLDVAERHNLFVLLTKAGLINRMDADRIMMEGNGESELFDKVERIRNARTI